jgi:hypothetical protein
MPEIIENAALNSSANRRRIGADAGKTSAAHTRAGKIFLR